MLCSSKFINDMRGISINLTNFFSSYVPLLDSFVIGPKNSLSAERTTSYSDKVTGIVKRTRYTSIIVAELLSISKSDETISDWTDLRDKFAKTETNTGDTEDFVRLAESHNDIIQELVERTYEFDRPYKYSEANNSIRFGTNKTRINKEEKREPLSKDDMEFIKGALNTVHEHENEINNAIKTINTLSENEQIDNTSKEQLLGAFDTLEDHFNDHPSNASNIIKSGLLQSFINLLKSNDHDILNSTLSIISCTLSNNESIINKASDFGLAESLLRLRHVLKATPLEPKLLSAISSSVRNGNVAEANFVKNGGLGYLSECIRSKNPKTRERAVLFLVHFLALDKLTKASIRNMRPCNIIKSLLPLEPLVQGIQYCEVCTRLFKLLLQKHRNCFTRDEMREITQLFSKDLKAITSMNQESLDEIKNVLLTLTQ
ncbi:hypothetical protein BEWA_021960 [Theileria equi strain WA]|uniref:Nucleotide exchange factor SIL1 n=1 Tax=Theileria equi strain WA TaxID=1537102 RepID=L0AVT4_THEEQ|nr:hypothetical protein BEWA_021960 [Theileria equi strain WA]AFZ79348.1 hypothetical protein BEWA_021960 [Theileria equi strain WA]|eukprot:XP_004829014.1 hypothetical protein BEWA_021960 [Theileria equi strain WA]